MPKASNTGNFSSTTSTDTDDAACPQRVEIKAKEQPMQDTKIVKSSRARELPVIERRIKRPCQESHTDEETMRLSNQDVQLTEWQNTEKKLR
jgi:hypothetical protein